MSTSETAGTLDEQVLIEFAARLHAESQERLCELADSPLSVATAVAETALSYIEEAGFLESHDLCPHEDVGPRPCRIVAYHLPDDGGTLELVTAPDQLGETIGTKEIGRLAGWTARFFEYAAKGDIQRFREHAPAHEAAERIKTSVNRIDTVRITIVTLGRATQRSVQDVEITGTLIQTEVWDLERLYRAAGEGVARDRIEIDFEQLLGRPLACLEMKPRPEEYETYLAILPGPLVFKLFERFGPRLFEFNVRSFLQARGAVNRGIQKTIREEPGRFLAFNNGLAATADHVEAGSWHGETVIRKVRGLQIVNGAQTTASIYRAVKVDKLSVEALAVAMKLTLVAPDRLAEFVPLIARYANTQNPIQIADLSAADRFHQQFEALAETVWTPGEESRWFYERARGSYQMARSLQGTTPARKRDFDRTCPASQHFGKTDLAKYLMAWWQQPHLVSRGAQKNYASFMIELRERHGEAWEPDKDFYQDTIAVAIVFRSIQRIVRSLRLQSYGANVVAYLVALLSKNFGEVIDRELLWETQTISDAMSEQVRLFAPRVHREIVETAGNRNVTEWCKKEECWHELRKLDVSISGNVPPELQSEQADVRRATTSHSGTTEDHVLSCMQLDGSTWARVVAWAVASPDIDAFDKRVAHTLSGYALMGWDKTPSIKQAVRGSRVIDAARAAGILPS